MKRVDFEELRRRHKEAQGSWRSKPGWKLKAWRLQRELSQAEAARLLGVSQPTLSQYELGVSVPQDEEVKRNMLTRAGVRW